MVGICESSACVFTSLPGLIELDPGKSSAPEKHLFEEYFFVLNGRGTCEVWNEGEKPERYDWHEGTCISPPAGTWHQHYNTGNQPCKFVALHANTAVQKEEKGNGRLW